MHGMGGGMHAIGGGMHFGGMGAGPRFSGVGPRFAGPRFAGGPFAAHAAVAPRVSHVGSPRFIRFAFHHRFFRHRFHRFAFFGAPFVYASYDSCWQRVWTRYGVQVVNVCGDYGYY